MLIAGKHSGTLTETQTGRRTDTLAHLQKPRERKRGEGKGKGETTANIQRPSIDRQTHTHTHTRIERERQDRTGRDKTNQTIRAQSIDHFILNIHICANQNQRQRTKALFNKFLPIQFQLGIWRFR